MLKKFLIYSLTVAVLFGAGFFGTNAARKHYRSVPSHGNPAYVQVRASHMLSFLDDDGEQTVWCSSTVIAEHALLTAAHCNDGTDEAKTINIDRSTRVYNLLASASDGRDHIIILVDGPAFVDIVPYVIREPKIDEPVFVEGFGNEIYPSEEKEGRSLVFMIQAKWTQGRKCSISTTQLSTVILVPLYTAWMVLFLGL